MTRKLVLSLITMGLILSIGMTPIKKEYIADQFDVDIAIQSDGSLLVTETTFSPLSTVGAQEARRWQGFYQYLRDVTRGREFLPRTDLLDEYLPYATSYGLAEAWSKLFKQQGRAQLPAWFQSLATTGAGDEGAGAFVALMAAAESSGSSSGDAGAAAAAGGGASGAY